MQPAEVFYGIGCCVAILSTVEHYAPRIKFIIGVKRYAYLNFELLKHLKISLAASSELNDIPIAISLPLCNA